MQWVTAEGSAKLYKQKKGAPIGLRASACLARLLMIQWDKTWATIQKNFGLKVHMFYRYVDDIRILLKPLFQGWKWSKLGWVYTKMTVWIQLHAPRI